jgi:type II secretory pathway component PulC
MVETSVRSNASGSSAESGQPVISRTELETFLSRGPAYAFSQVDTEPHHAAGDFVGFQVVDVTAEAHQYIAPHLRVGDVITHVNGVRLKRPDDYLQAWRGLGEAGSIRIDFLREGEPTHVTWSVR